MNEATIMPSPLEIARAVSQLLSVKLTDFNAERIELCRDEAALCLGLVTGLVEQLENEADAS